MKTTCIVSSVDQLKRKVAAYKELIATPHVKVSGTFQEANGNTVWLTSGSYVVTDIGGKYITINDGTPKPLRVRFCSEYPDNQVRVTLS